MLASNCRSASDYRNTSGYFYTSWNLTLQAFKNNPSWRDSNFTATGQHSLWVSAVSASNATPSSLSEFYVISSKDSPSWTSKTDGLKDYFALKGTLSLCIKTHQTIVSFGQTATTVVDTQRDLQWLSENRSTPGFDGPNWTTTDALGSEFSINLLNLLELNQAISIGTFYGLSNGQVSDPDSGGYPINSATSDAALSLAAAVHTDRPNGTEGFRNRVANLETALSNAYNVFLFLPLSE